MCDIETGTSVSHAMSKILISKQAHSLDIELIQKATSRKDYENNFKEVIELLKKKGVSAGVFGDIYLKEHRVWIERVCNEMKIEAIFPLWGIETKILLSDFVNLGFQTIIVSVNKVMLNKSWLGKVINKEFINDILLLENIDPCAENGEYHTFVYNGPNFNETVSFKIASNYEADNHYYLKLEPNE
jgi:uncharacterized protein (TIGR00290 family)